MVYLLIGQDVQAKEIQLRKIKEEFLSKELRDFNLDTLYAKEITLKQIQERLLSIPVESAKRIIVIKGADYLSEESRDFLALYSRKGHKQIILVMDFEHYDSKDEFIKNLGPYAKTMRFQETINPDAFALNRQIELRKTDYALRLLNQMLRNGQAPERILGALRYAWERQNNRTGLDKKKLKLLRACDIEIKTGRLKPAFALERLIISLCAFTQAPH